MVNKQKIAFIGNQGGKLVYHFYYELHKNLKTNYDYKHIFILWLEKEVLDLVNNKDKDLICCSFEKFVNTTNLHNVNVQDKVLSKYPEVNWSEVIASERSFTDYSQLLGSSGQRDESLEYVCKLITYIIEFLEKKLKYIDIIICQNPDTLFSLIVYKVAKKLKIKIFSITPAWLLEPNSQGGFLSNDEFLKCNKMEDIYFSKKNQELSSLEQTRVRRLINSIIKFDGKTAFYDKNFRTQSAGKSFLTPNLMNLVKYIKINSKKNKFIEYNKFEINKKIKANFIRFYRKLVNEKFLLTKCIANIPKKSIFFGLHYQPEMSTLVQGIWSSNQISLIEDISKSLPIGYSLVIKEHPWGRGNRPTWQYKHLEKFYNVFFCDLPSKVIIDKVDCVIAITGTIAMEALVKRKPVIILGQSYFNFCELFYKVKNVRDLHKTLYNILIKKEYQKIDKFDIKLGNFLISYLEGLIPYFPVIEFANEWANAIAIETKMRKNKKG